MYQLLLCEKPLPIMKLAASTFHVFFSLLLKCQCSFYVPFAKSVTAAGQVKLDTKNLTD